MGLYKDAIEVLKKQGATVVEVELMKGLQETGGAEFAVLQYEFKDGLNRYLAKANARVKSLADVIAFNNQERGQSHALLQTGNTRKQPGQRRPNQ